MLLTWDLHHLLMDELVATSRNMCWELLVFWGSNQELSAKTLSTDVQS